MNYTPLIIAKNVIRTVFVAPKGMKFNVCDLNAIETRVGAWVAECPALLDVFNHSVEDGGDPYLSFSVKLTGIPYQKLYYDLKKSVDKALRAIAKKYRQDAKPGLLQAIYRAGGGGWGWSKNKYKDHQSDCNAEEVGKKNCKCPEIRERIKTGVWGYCEKNGIEMTLERAHEIVKIFRESYPEICGNGHKGQIKGIWIRLEEAISDVLKGERVIRRIGPNNCIKIDKLTIEGRAPILRILLPSGRYIHYFDASIQTVKMPWKTKKEVAVQFDEDGNEISWDWQETDDYRPAFTYYGMNQDTKQWSLVVSHGGKVYENIVQGLSRDILATKLLEIDEIGLEIVGHVHDEGITLSSDDPFSLGVLEMEKIMNRPIDWLPGLPLGSDGFENDFYRK